VEFCDAGREGSPAIGDRRTPPAGDRRTPQPFVRPFNQAPAAALARKVPTKLSNVSIFIIEKRSGEEKVPAPTLGTIPRPLCSIVWRVNSPPKALARISPALVSS
jgi:hypothetical protein